MEVALTGLLLLLGLVIGLLVERAGHLKALASARQDNLDLNRRLSAFEALQPELEEAQSRLKDERDRLQTLIEAQQMDLSSLNRKISTFEALQPQLEETQLRIKNERDRFQKLSETQQADLAKLSASVGALETEKQLLEQQLKVQHEYLTEIKRQTKVEFENLAHEILKTRSKEFNDQTEKNLDAILKPLKEKIQTFEKKVDETYSNEAKERFALKAEIERLVGLNDRMTKETQSLTQALRGDSKTQGDWGEMVLQKILEASGLVEGREYSEQKSFENEEGDRMRPDIVINLPESKHVVVDSKVSLKAYDLHRSAEDEEDKDEALVAHLKSIEKHIDDLSEKHYSKLKSVNSPEFVLLFIPIEPAYLLAMQSNSGLSERAWKKGIAIVTATTLLTTLKTVASIWRLEKQTKNAVEIANEGAKLYDKFVGFLEDFEKIGKTFDSGKLQFQSAMGKLKEGPGNVFRKMEVLRELGAAPTKRIKSDQVE